MEQTQALYARSLRDHGPAPTFGFLGTGMYATLRGRGELSLPGAAANSIRVSERASGEAKQFAPLLGLSPSLNLCSSRNTDY
ncbi:MAG: hypothetical protein QOH35_220 [Acidobacteriaceae bacterium]|nr:hypothetical protein [Acidobacteriaceae bacterium]